MKCCPMVAHGKKITTKVPDQYYNIGVKGQGQIRSNSDVWLEFLFVFYGGYNYLAQWLLTVYILQQKFQITNVTLESKVKVIYTQNICLWLVIWTTLLFFDRMLSYLEQWLPIVCRLQRRLRMQIWPSKRSRSNMFKVCLLLSFLMGGVYS